MSDLTIVERRIDLFDRVSVVDDGRVDYDGDYLRAAYPTESEPSEYVVAQFSYESNNDTADIQIPNNSILLEIENGNVLALVPSEAYRGGE